VGVQGRDDLPSAMDAMRRDHTDALIVLSNALFSVVNTPEIPELIARSRLPTMHYDRASVVAGALMSYGPSLDSLYRRAAYYVDRILKGTKPAELPVEQPMYFDFVVNMKTARELGITFPPEIQLQVTEVIQ
jgi:putative ABC transport system substrate-binding protein